MTSRPLRENLEVHSDDGEQWIRCARCSQVLSRLDQDWRGKCKKKLLPPTGAGPLMSDLNDRYLFEKLFCPSCGALFNAEMVEETHDG